MQRVHSAVQVKGYRLHKQHADFRQFCHLLLLAKILSANLLFYVNDYIHQHVEDMAMFTALVKIYSAEYFCNTGSWAMQNFCPAKIFGYTVHTCITYLLHYLPGLQSLSLDG